MPPCQEDRSSSIIENVKWFMFGDETTPVRNEFEFEHELDFVSWVGDSHSFIVSDGKNEYRVSVTKEVL